MTLQERYLKIVGIYLLGGVLSTGFVEEKTQLLAQLQQEQQLVQQQQQQLHQHQQQLSQLQQLRQHQPEMLELQVTATLQTVSNV